jgi:Uma2 family endonuclease
MKYIPVLQPGEIEEDRPMPSRNHSRVCHKIEMALYAYRERVRVYPQLNLNLDGWQSIPDVCAYPAGVLPEDRENDELEVTVPPTLVIEVLSPMQNVQPMVEKAREYIQHGVQTCWLVVPLGTVFVFPRSGPSYSLTTGKLSEPALGIEVDVEELFP